jgi:hypothetical protein
MVRNWEITIFSYSFGGKQPAYAIPYLAISQATIAKTCAIHEATNPNRAVDGPLINASLQNEMS